MGCGASVSIQQKVGSARYGGIHDVCTSRLRLLHVYLVIRLRQSDTAVLLLHMHTNPRVVALVTDKLPN